MPVPLARRWHVCGAPIDEFVGFAGSYYVLEYWAVDDGRLLRLCPRCSAPLHAARVKGDVLEANPMTERAT